MAVTAVKTWVAGEVLTAADLNAEFANVYDNGESLGWPATTNKDLNGKALILDGDADSQLAVASDDIFILQLQGVAAVTVDGDASSPVTGITITTGATGVAPQIQASGESNLDLNISPAGTGVLQIGGDHAGTYAQLVYASQWFAR